MSDTTRGLVSAVQARALRVIGGTRCARLRAEAGV